MMKKTSDKLNYSIDFDLPEYPEALKESCRQYRSWDSIVELFEEQRRAYMKDHDSPESRLENKVADRFVLTSGL